MQTITRKGTFDSAHRVMNEKMKCFNIHGHTYLYELTFAFDQTRNIGYAIDFKEIKRVLMHWIDYTMDHAVILNPKDEKMIEVANLLGSKLWIMSLNGKEYCNPTVENIAKELFFAVSLLTKSIGKEILWLQSIRLYETPNCFTDFSIQDINVTESNKWMKENLKDIMEFSNAMGEIEYDDRVK